MGTLMIELLIRKNSAPPEALERLSDVITKFRIAEFDDRIVLNTPVDWAGLYDGTLHDIRRELGEGVYIALAYFALGDDEIVTDFNGVKVPRHPAIFNSKKVWKYVKRRMRIITIHDREREVFEVKGYSLEFSGNITNPVVKVLDIYSVGSESNFHVDFFLPRGADDQA